MARKSFRFTGRSFDVFLLLLLTTTRWSTIIRLAGFWDALTLHYSDVTMGAMVSQITSVSIVYSIVCSGTDQRKHQSLRVTGLCGGNSPGTGEFPAQKASNAENVSIWWRHHACNVPVMCTCGVVVVLIPHGILLSHASLKHDTRGLICRGRLAKPALRLGEWLGITSL